MASRRWIIPAILTILWLTAPRAEANGVVSHMHISDLARELLPPGELSDLLSDPALVEINRAGSVFPDSGYAADDPYGEMAHWEPFTEAYLQHIRETYGPPPYVDAEARAAVAFLLGQASHGMADQWFDSLFMARVDQWDGTDETLDTYAEPWLIIEHDPDNLIEGWVDAPTMNRVFAERLGYEPGEETLEEGMETIVMAIGALYGLADILYEMYWRELPWAATHYYLSGDEAPGSLPHIAQVVAFYWQVLWQRLAGTDEMGASFLLSWPPEGQMNFEVDHELVETRIALAFGHGLDRDTLTSENVRLLGPGETPVEARVRFIYGSAFANVVLVEPQSALDFDTEYTVEAGPGLTAMDGRALPEAVTLSFHTRCAPELLDECPPLPEPWVAPEGPPPRPDAGPGDADPADADLGDADLGDADLGDADPGDADLGDADPASDGGPPPASEPGCGCGAAGGPATTRPLLRWLGLS